MCVTCKSETPNGACPSCDDGITGRMLSKAEGFWYSTSDSHTDKKNGIVSPDLWMGTYFFA